MLSIMCPTKTAVTKNDQCIRCIKISLLNDERFIAEHILYRSALNDVTTLWRKELSGQVHVEFKT